MKSLTLAAIVSTALTLAVTSVQGAGTGAGGRGIAVTSTGGIGRPSGDGLSSVGFSSGSHAGAVGTRQSVASSSFNRSMDQTFSTGSTVHSPGGKGRSTESGTAAKMTPNPIVRGIGDIASSPGGRGL